MNSYQQYGKKTAIHNKEQVSMLVRHFQPLKLQSYEMQVNLLNKKFTIYEYLHTHKVITESYNCLNKHLKQKGLTV